MNSLEVAVLTSDFRLLSRLVEEGRRRGVRIVHTADSSHIPLTARVVVTKRGEMTAGETGLPTVYADDYGSVTSVVDRAVEVAAGREWARTVTISVDPGSRAGLAFIVGDLLVRTESFTDLSDLERCVKEFVEGHKGMTAKVVIGSGAPQYREQVINMIRRMPELANAKVEIVSEEGTSKRGLFGKRRRGRDEDAAAILSMRRRHVRRSP